MLSKHSLSTKEWQARLQPQNAAACWDVFLTMCYIVVPPAEDGEDCLILISVCTMLECLLSVGALQGIFLSLCFWNLLFHSWGSTSCYVQTPPLTMDDWVSGLGNYWEFHGDKIAMIQDSDDKKCFWFEDGQVPDNESRLLKAIKTWWSIYSSISTKVIAVEVPRTFGQCGWKQIRTRSVVLEISDERELHSCLIDNLYQMEHLKLTWRNCKATVLIQPVREVACQ
jgi:hypothetical protein